MRIKSKPNHRITDVTSFKPGHPDFEKEAAKAIPLNQIRNGFSNDRTCLTADIATSTPFRRNESINKMR